MWNFNILVLQEINQGHLIQTFLNELVLILQSVPRRLFLPEVWIIDLFSFRWKARWRDSHSFQSNRRPASNITTHHCRKTFSTHHLIISLIVYISHLHHNVHLFISLLPLNRNVFSVASIILNVALSAIDHQVLNLPVHMKLTLWSVSVHPGLTFMHLASLHHACGGVSFD